MLSTGNKIILLFFCLFFYHLLQAETVQDNHVPTYACVVDVDDDFQAALAHMFAQSRFVSQIQLETDTLFSRAEFDYITGLKQDSCIGKDDVANALEMLFKKNKFSAIGVQLERKQDDDWLLRISLQSFWTIGRVMVNGLITGKQLYSQYYGLEPGDIFDTYKHEHSLERIRAQLKKEGYFDGQVAADLVYHNTNKLVDVVLRIRRKQQFVIGTITVQAVCAHTPGGSESNAVAARAQKILCKRFTSNYYNHQTLTQAAQALKRYCIKRGFGAARIQLTETIDRAQKKVHLYFNVDLGQQRTIIFAGNTFFTRSQLLDVVCNFGGISWLVPPTLLAQEIMQMYRKKGFLDVEVHFQEQQGNSLFTISEGNRIAIKNVLLRGVHVADALALSNTCFAQLLKQKYFDTSLFEKCLAELLAWYANQGFTRARLLKQEFSCLANQDYELVLTIDEGEKIVLVAPQAQESAATTQEAVFGRTIIVGDNGTQFDQIMRELAYKEGDPWNPDLVKCSLLRLKDLSIFDVIHLYPDRWSHDPLRKNLILKVHNDDPYELRTRLGFGTERVGRHFAFGHGITYRFGGTLYCKNVTNNSDYIALDVDVTRPQRIIQLLYRRPWLFGMPIRTLVNVYSNRYDQPGFTGDKDTLYEVVNQGFSFELQRLYNRLEYKINTGFEWMETKIAGGMDEQARAIGKAINLAPQSRDKNIPMLIVEPSVQFDNVDNRVDPRAGYFTLLLARAMVPLSYRHRDACLFKLVCEQSAYVQLRPAWVLALRLRIGHIFHKQFSAIMPNDRFYLGGARSLRGYQTDLCPPLGNFVDMTGVERWAPQGGKSMLNLNLEVRFPLYKLLGAVLFQDLGYLGASLRPTEVKAGFVAGTGFGLRYNTPIGPLRFDMGWKWRKNPSTDHRYTWYLTLGHAF